MVRKIMERTSDVSTHVTPHVFRHTTASVALDRGMNIVDVSKLLGHNCVETTSLLFYLRNERWFLY